MFSRLRLKFCREGSCLYPTHGVLLSKCANVLMITGAGTKLMNDNKSSESCDKK
jgi:hypothetical protein